MFLWQCSIHEIALFGGFSGPNSPKILPDFAKKFYQRIHKQCLKNFGKMQILQKREIPKVCRFGLTLTPFSPLKIAEIEKSRHFLDKTSAIGLSKYANGKTVSPLSFKWKIGLLYALFESLLGKIWAWSKVRGSESKSNLAYPEV